MTRAEKILEQHPDIGEYIIKSMNNEQLDMVVGLYNAGITSEQIKLMAMLGNKDD